MVSMSGAEAPVHVRELELVLEVGERAQAAHDHLRAALLHVVDEQALEGVDLDARVAADRVADVLLALLDA